MDDKTFLEINPEQFKAFMQMPPDQPVVMLNLLKFKKKDVETGLSGEASYSKYMKVAMPFFKKANAEVLFFGHPQQMLIGPEDEVLWDKVLLIKYESLTDFISMVKAEGYPSHLRKQALLDSRLIHCES